VLEILPQVQRGSFAKENGEILIAGNGGQVRSRLRRRAPHGLLSLRLLRSAIDAGTVERITSHLRKMNSSVLESTCDHANASKRLNEFASALARIARKTVHPKEILTNRMLLFAAILRGASAELASGGKLPDWPAPFRAD
jgi:hypothetical protein